jgi:deferrochelatase/peroxidase EfeB
MAPASSIGSGALPTAAGSRRGYSYTDGIELVRGTLLGGLFFIAFVKNPSQFIALQTRLGSDDALNEYVQHQGSAVFACPPGLTN